MLVADNSLDLLVKTDDGSYTIRHKGHGQTYHSNAGALLEARSLYIDSSGIKESLNGSPTVNVLDVGLGLGYNALATIDCFMKMPSESPLSLVSLENEIDVFTRLSQGRGEWQKNWPSEWIDYCSCITHVSDKVFEASFKNERGHLLNWTIIIDDAHQVHLEKFSPFHFVWQDPFSPEKNPSMWNEKWFRKVLEASSEDVILMSYSVSRVVKDACTSAGFQFERIPASGRKRHWLRVFR